MRTQFKYALTLKLIHSTKNRARFKYSCLKDFRVNPMPLRIELDSLQEILNVRINTLLNNIIVQYNGDLKRIQETIFQILLKHLKQCNFQ